MEDRWYLAALLQCRHIGSVRMRRLYAAVSSAKEIWSLSFGDLKATGALSPTLAEELIHHIEGHSDLPGQIEEDCTRQRIAVCTINDDLYPIVLREIFDPPLVLYYRGTLIPDARRIGIVGARKFTAYGEAAAMEFAERLARSGVTITSGAARGIDTRAHRGALRGGRTVAVLGCGVDIAYPPENRRLLSQIVESGGAVLSEYAPGTQPLPAFFPARNRIISGLSEGTLVVEAAKRSGSLITAEMALSEGRDVYAVPGSIYSPQSGGCHNLIRAGARLVESPQEILEEMHLAEPPRRPVREQMTPEEARIFQVLSFEHALTMDEIMDSLPDTITTSIPLLLLQMQLKGLITENEMHAYRRVERN
ncbi:DNA-processing protein DprA [Selenomonas noxia]|uniref:DNA-processing protein DprA n=1 Tax=Selenomonas noxia TaxID=135083 RepID=UPI0023F1FF86|nr:DNA-processing protein DprA [Selenomonas noxia]